MSIGENLKRIRENRGLCLRDIAEEVGVTKSMLCQIERGTKTLSLPLAKDLSIVLACSIDDFLK